VSLVTLFDLDVVVFPCKLRSDSYLYNIFSKFEYLFTPFEYET